MVLKVAGIDDAGNLPARFETRLASLIAGAKQRSAHVGTQDAQTTLTNLAEAVQDIMAATIIAGPNITATYNDVANTLTISSTGGGGSSTLGGLTDVDVSTAVTGMVLMKQSDGTWVGGSVGTDPNAGGGTGVTRLDGLDDVNIPLPRHGALLRYDANVAQWESDPVLIGNLILPPGTPVPPGTPPAVVWRLPVTLIKTHGFEGTAGTAVTAASEGFTTMSGSPAPQYTNDVASAVGSTHMTVLAGNAGYGSDTGLALATCVARAYVRFPPTPTGLLNFMNMRDTTVSLAALQRQTSGAVALKNGTGNTQGALTTTLLATGTWYRIEWKVGSASQTLRIFDLAGTLLEEVTRPATAGSVDTVRFGVDVNFGGTLKMDAAAVAADWIGPA